MAKEVIWLKGHVYGGNYTAQQAFDLIPVPQKWVEVEPRPGIPGSRLFWNKGLLLQEVIQEGKLPVALLDWQADANQADGEWRDLGVSVDTIPESPEKIRFIRKDERFNERVSNFYTDAQRKVEAIEKALDDTVEAAGKAVASAWSFGKVAVVALAAFFVVSAVRKR